MPACFGCPVIKVRKNFHPRLLIGFLQFSFNACGQLADFEVLLEIVLL
jgi:hypothetical protein